MERFDVVESATLTLSAEDATGARWNALLIKKGWGAKGYYTEEALRNDGPSVFKAGTPIFVDHLKPEDREFYNFGKVTNLVGELATDAVWSDELQGLTAEVEIFEHQRAMVKSIAKKVGLSIRALTNGSSGEAEGRRGKIFTSLVGAKSVDLVVRAGAGGQLLDVLESAVTDEMDTEQMDELKELLKGFDTKLDAFGERLHTVEESLTAEKEAEKEAEVVAEVEAEKSAEAEAEAPEVDIEKTVTELVAAELKRMKDAEEHTESAAETNGTEENLAEESAKDEIKLPTRWAVKGAK